MTFMFWNWMLFMSLASTAICIVLWRSSHQLPLTHSVSLWAIALGYAAMFLAQSLGFPEAGFWALLVAVTVVICTIDVHAYTGSVFAEPECDSASVVAVYKTINNEWDDWKRAEAYRKRIEGKSPEFLHRAMLIVLNDELRLMIDEQLAVYRSRRHLARVA